MATTDGGLGGLGVGAPGGAPSATTVVEPAFTVVVTPWLVTVAEPSMTFTVAVPSRSNNDFDMVPRTPIVAVGVRMT